ncbi:MAG: SPASM domain-containing protein, partial [Myxococcales bacterium]
DILLEPWQTLDLLPMLAGMQERGTPLGMRIWPANNIGYYGASEHILRPFGPFGGCGAGRTLLGLEANGDIKGCPSLPTDAYVGGNIRDHSLQQIWEQTAPLRFTRERTADDLWGYCRGCYYADTCLAGCSWTTHVLFGRPGNNPYCVHRATEMLREGKRERLVQVSSAGGRPFDHGHFEIVVEDWPADELAARQAAIV